MALMTLLAFLFLAISFLSLWFLRDPKIWGALLGLSMICGLFAGNSTWIGALFIACLSMFWIIYTQKPKIALFVLIICISTALKMHFLPGFSPFIFTPKFAISLEGPLIGLFPLALLVPLAKDLKDWKKVLKGFLFGCGGIGILALLATLSGTTHWQIKIPSFIAVRSLSNLFLTSIPEEGFYRGFMQNTSVLDKNKFITRKSLVLSCKSFLKVS